ncbi:MULTISPECIES: hypothetical protein [Bradyrhizobium]|uniref:hypothetical protein n=2 Tax=Nitrobacteraceae TaxID=41294 RepID=UPI00211DEF63|nr:MULTISPECIES: hypothetical protein [Bradyrhizobium]
MPAGRASTRFGQVVADMMQIDARATLQGAFFCAGTAGLPGVARACGCADAASGVAIAIANRRHCPATT